MKAFGRAWLYAYVVLAIVGALFAHDTEGVVKALVLAVLEAVVVAAIFVAIIRPRRK